MIDFTVKVVMHDRQTEVDAGRNSIHRNGMRYVSVGEKMRCPMTGE